MSSAKDEGRGGAIKLQARDENGPVGQTPNSVERKPKGRRQRTSDEGDQSAQNQDTTVEVECETELENIANGNSADEEHAEAFAQATYTLPPAIPAPTATRYAEPVVKPSEREEGAANKRRPLQTIPLNIPRDTLAPNNAKHTKYSHINEKPLEKQRRETGTQAEGNLEHTSK